MKTSKQAPSDLSSSRRAQPLRQTRINPPRSSISGARPFGGRASVDENQSIDIFPAITHFADAITALPKELVRHFTLLKEVDAKIFAPEEELSNLINAALNAPLPDRRHHALGPTSAPMSAQGSLNGSVINGHSGSANLIPEPDDAYSSNNVPRRQLFQHITYTTSNMLVSLDEKNHVIATAAEALNKQLARIDDCFPYIELEISEEARYGSTTHWAYPENRVPKTGAVSRREVAAANSLSAAAQHLVDEAAARSDARKQALLERKKSKAQHVDSDFDDQDNRQKDKKLHGNSKVRKAADAGVGLGITNGATTNGNPPKRQKVANKTPAAGAGMERSLSSVFGTNGTATKGKTGSPRETPVPEGPKKRSRAAAGTGQTRKRNNTVNSAAMSPSLASSPIRTTFPETKATGAGAGTPPPTNGRPASIRGRQNSTQSMIEKRAPSEVTAKQNGNTAGTPDLNTAATITGRAVPEVKVTMKETASNSKGEHLLEDVNQDPPEMVGGLLVGSRKGSTIAKQEETESNGSSMHDIQSTTVTTKSGRASKPSTPAIPSFPEAVRSRSSRTLDTASLNKRSHKKGAGAAAQLLAQQVQPDDGDDAASNVNDDDIEEEVAEDELTYCYCNGVSYGEMVGCDAPDCEREWFHLECVGLKVAPKANAKWFCDDCIKKRPNQKRR